MKKESLADNTKPYVGLASKANSNSDDENGASIDLRGVAQCNAGIAVVNIGAPTGTPTSFSVTVKLQDSADNSTFADVAGKTTGALAAAGVAEISFDPSTLRRYIRLNRVVATSGGTSPTVPNGAEILLGDPQRRPLT